MNSRAISVKPFFLWVIIFLASEINPSPLLVQECWTTCGNLAIPFPFGTSIDCCLDDSFLITCNQSYNPPKPFLNSGDIEVLEISLDGQIKVASPVVSNCYDDSGFQIHGTTSQITLYRRFPISSTRNKFTAVGCDTYALVEGSDHWKQKSAGCVSTCDSIESVAIGTCSGIGCCQTSIPKGVKDFISMDVRSFRNHTRVKSFNPCGYGFVVEVDAFEFSSTDLENLRNKKSFPVVLDWSVGNVTCQIAKNLSSYACRAVHSVCSDSSYELGYGCSCLTGFHGNAYLSDGCEDIDECNTASNPCVQTCKNSPGSYSCSCSEGFGGDGTKAGSGCRPKTRQYPKDELNGTVLFYIASCLLIPAVGISWIFRRRRENQVTKQFKRNGGLILQKKLQNMLSGQQIVRIFSAAELKKATNDYDESRVIFSREHYLVYKGVLESYQMVTICRHDELEEKMIDEFIKKLVTRAQLHHRNVLKLIGCCLETRVPMLVYEFVTNKTLFTLIHDTCIDEYLSWMIRLKIAAEIATALAYLHSECPDVVIHKFIKTANILLDENGTAKVSNFGPAGLISLGLETSGYSDPEYYDTGKLTEKSDVYSFGVVLVELLTGRTVSYDLPIHFVHLFKEDRLIEIFDTNLILDARIEHLREVAAVAVKCMEIKSEERPSMKKVAMVLEVIQEKASVPQRCGRGKCRGALPLM